MFKKNINQFNASNPKSSIWVFASAGTGKTKILIDRFLRLILSGTDFTKIICITFTKAAANEMLERLVAKLTFWSSATDLEIIDSIFQITGITANKEEIDRAKSFYKEIINSNKEINIQTIHSLCKTILLKFPIEADISLNFQILDQSLLDSITDEIRNKIFFGEDNADLKFIIENIHDLKIIELINLIINNSVKFHIFFNKYKTQKEYEKFLIKLLCINLTKEDLYQKLTILGSIEINNIAIQKNDEKLINNYNRYVRSNIYQKIDEFNNFKINFLNKEGKKRSKLITNKLVQDLPELLLELQKVQEIIYGIDQGIKNLNLLEFSKEFYNFAKIILNLFEELKYKNNALSYDDLITKTTFLLNDSDIKDWILYKLDGGFDHILIDEAQDTSPLQWQIINALTEEFFSGSSSKTNERSLFVVGDDKQSIYSFQGADVKNYLRIKNFLQNKIIESKNEFSEIFLDISYRSSKAIIKSVDYIMNYIKVNYPDSAEFNYNLLEVERINDFGSVEIWPLSQSDSATKELFWPIPDEIIKSDPPYKDLCDKIASFIKSEINKGHNFDDFMILVRKRDSFILELIRILESNNIKTSGLDRIDLKENLSIMDLISLSKFVMLPDDDLNLAGLILSPIIGCNDEELLSLRQNKNSSIWNNICESNKKLYEKLLIYIDLYKNTDLVGFFLVLIEGLEIKKKLNNNGPESNDAIDQFLKLVVNYSKSQNQSLQDFLIWFDSSELVFTRDNISSSSVKISTIHGAKGLESKIVILIDSCTLPIEQNPIIFDKDDNIVFPGRSSNMSDLAKTMLKDNSQFDEYLRLLYVGLTRAKERLVICGYSNSQPNENCWYNICYNALSKYGSVNDTDKTIFITEGIVNNYINIKEKHIFPEKEYSKSFDESNFKFVKALSNDSIQYINDDSLEYGIVFHNIMQYIVKNNIDLTLDNNLSNIIPSKFSKKILTKISLLAQSQEFLGLNKEYKLYTEISFTLLKRVGRIDLLAIGKDDIIIIDYKSDKIVPETLSEINDNYIEQINFYESSIINLFPNKKIIKKILWLETMEFMLLH